MSTNANRNSRRKVRPAPPDNSLWMVRQQLRDIPQARLPVGYSIRGMTDRDAAIWTAIQRDAEKVIPIDDGLLAREFGNDRPAWPRRCLLLFGPDRAAIGTVSAWYGTDAPWLNHGRIHWFAIHPSHQGKGLARPLLSHAMNLLAQWHERAYLVTSIGKLRAIKLYLDYGFVPLLRTELDRHDWSRFRKSLDHPGLDKAVHAAGAHDGALID